MKKFVFLMILPGLMSMMGCVRYAVNGQQRTVIMLQVGVVVKVVNNCAPLIDLERVGGVVATGLKYSQSATIPLVSTPFSGSNRQIALTAKGFKTTPEGQVYLGSQTRTFSVSTNEGSREEVWEIDYLQLPRGRGGCQ